MLPSRCAVVSIGNPRSYCGVIYLDKKYCRLAELVFGQVNDLRHCRNATMPYLTLDSGLLCIPTPNNKKKGKKQTQKAHFDMYFTIQAAYLQYLLSFCVLWGCCTLAP